MSTVAESKLSSQPFHGLESLDVARLTDSDMETGLSAERVAQCYALYGWNELPVIPGKPGWLRFLLQFHQPLLYILLVAGG